MYVCTYKKIDVPCFMGTVSASVPACVHPDWAASTKHHLFNMNSATLPYQREYIFVYLLIYPIKDRTETSSIGWTDGRTVPLSFSLCLSVSLSRRRVVCCVRRRAGVL